MNTQEYIAIEDQFGAHNYKPLDVVISKAKGVWVTDADGKKYLDCLSAYSAQNQGHCHPRIVKAMVDQAKKVALTSRAFRNDQLPLFYKKLHDLLGYEMAIPMNSGAEAVETAIKLARKWAYEVKGIQSTQPRSSLPKVLHGRTTTIVSFSTEQFYKDAFGPFTPGFTAVPTATWKPSARPLAQHCRHHARAHPGRERRCTVPKGYLSAVSQLCRENNILFIADEIQTGLGRTAKWLACQHEGVRPDMVCLGKALSGGMLPVSVVLADAPIMNLFKPGEHGSVWRHQPPPLPSSALEVLDEEKLAERAVELGAYFMEKLRDQIQRSRSSRQGLAHWCGAVPSAGGARKYCEELQKLGILCKETHDHVIRFARH